MTASHRFRYRYQDINEQYLVIVENNSYLIILDVLRTSSASPVCSVVFTGNL